LVFHPQVIRSDMEPTVTRADKSRREHKTLIFFLVALEMVAAVILIVGLLIDNDSLRVASYALGMPVTFALLGNLGLYLSWSDKKKRASRGPDSTACALPSCSRSPA
jgi:hypothetical protein